MVTKTVTVDTTSIIPMAITAAPTSIIDNGIYVQPFGADHQFPSLLPGFLLVFLLALAAALLFLHDCSAYARDILHCLHAFSSACFVTVGYWYASCVGGTVWLSPILCASLRTTFNWLGYVLAGCFWFTWTRFRALMKESAVELTHFAETKWPIWEPIIQRAFGQCVTLAAELFVGCLFVPFHILLGIEDNFFHRPRKERDAAMKERDMWKARYNEKAKDNVLLQRDNSEHKRGKERAESQLAQEKPSRDKIRAEYLEEKKVMKAEAKLEKAKAQKEVDDFQKEKTVEHEAFKCGFEKKKAVYVHRNQYWLEYKDLEIEEQSVKLAEQSIGLATFKQLGKNLEKAGVKIAEDGCTVLTATVTNINEQCEPELSERYKSAVYGSECLRKELKVEKRLTEELSATVVELKYDNAILKRRLHAKIAGSKAQSRKPNSDNDSQIEESKVAYAKLQDDYAKRQELVVKTQATCEKLKADVVTIMALAESSEAKLKVVNEQISMTIKALHVDKNKLEAKNMKLEDHVQELLKKVAALEARKEPKDDKFSGPKGDGPPPPGGNGAPSPEGDGPPAPQGDGVPASKDTGPPAATGERLPTSKNVGLQAPEGNGPQKPQEAGSGGKQPGVSAKKEAIKKLMISFQRKEYNAAFPHGYCSIDVGSDQFLCGLSALSLALQQQRPLNMQASVEDLLYVYKAIRARGQFAEHKHNHLLDKTELNHILRVWCVGKEKQLILAYFADTPNRKPAPDLCSGFNPARSDQGIVWLYKKADEYSTLAVNRALWQALAPGNEAPKQPDTGSKPSGTGLDGARFPANSKPPGSNQLRTDGKPPAYGVGSGEAGSSGNKQSSHAAGAPKSEKLYKDRFDRDFPRGYLTVKTPKQGLICGLHAITTTMKLMFPKIERPTVIDLRAAFQSPACQGILKAPLLEGQTLNENFFGADQLGAVLMHWASLIGRRVYLGFLVDGPKANQDSFYQKPHICIPDDKALEAPDVIVVWVHHDGEAHFQAMKPK